MWHKCHMGFKRNYWDDGLLFRLSVLFVKYIVECVLDSVLFCVKDLIVDFCDI